MRLQLSFAMKQTAHKRAHTCVYTYLHKRACLIKLGFADKIHEYLHMFFVIGVSRVSTYWINQCKTILLDSVIMVRI